MSKMVQYGVWPNCCNACDFCLREERIPYTKDQQIFWLEAIKDNIKTIDWKNDFSSGVSLLGGELYFIEDVQLQEKFMQVIDTIIKYVLVTENSKYSTVTNGLYNPEFLFRVIDRIVDAVGISHIDVNFSYDLKYRYKKKEDHQLVLNNINAFHDRYDYKVGVQMILTQYLIDSVKNGSFSIDNFLDQVPGNILTFLYPHPIHTGKKLKDFFFKRESFLSFMQYLSFSFPQMYENFLFSTKNSAVFKYTGLHGRDDFNKEEAPVLSNGKEVLNKCGHSILYKCYADCDDCMLCDLCTLSTYWS